MPAPLEDFRQAMRRLAASVSIVTSRCDGAPIGMTATAVSSLSTDPPSLLICVNRSANFHDAVVSVGRFCVNILGIEDAELCAVFGGKLKGSERFGAGDWADDEVGIPYLTSAQANLFCRVDGQMVYGTHTIFIGLVRAVRIAGAPAPLIYGDGALGRVHALDA